MLRASRVGIPLIRMNRIGGPRAPIFHPLSLPSALGASFQRLPRNSGIQRGRGKKHRKQKEVLLRRCRECRRAGSLKASPGRRAAWPPAPGRAEPVFSPGGGGVKATRRVGGSLLRSRRKKRRRRQAPPWSSLQQAGEDPGNFRQMAPPVAYSWKRASCPLKRFAPLSFSPFSTTAVFGGGVVADKMDCFSCFCFCTSLALVRP